MPATVISIVNRKGGVGKTSSAFHLGGCLADHHKKRVLLIDNDPQHSLSAGFRGVQDAGCLPAEQTIVSLYDETCVPDEQELIHHTDIPNLDLIAGSDNLSYFNRADIEDAGPLQLVLKDFIDTIRDDYDYVIIDNPPNLQLCSMASLAASDAALAITQSEDFGSHGGSAVKELISQIQRSFNPKIQFLGFVLNLYVRRLILHQAFAEALRKEYGDLVFQTHLPLAVHFKEAISARTPITLFKSRSIAAESIRELSDELLQRLAKPETQLLRAV